MLVAAAVVDRSTRPRDPARRPALRRPEKSGRPCGDAVVKTGARGRNRTGTPCGEGFSYHFDFRRRRLRVVRGLERAFAMASRLKAPAVRSLHLPSRCGPGLARRWRGCMTSRAFTDFDGRHLSGFPDRAQIIQVPCVYLFHHSGVVRIANFEPTYWLKSKFISRCGSPRKLPIT